MTKDTTHPSITEQPVRTKPARPSQPTASTSGLAITSLVLGILSFTGFGLLTGVPAIITGIIALKKGQHERAMSIAGIILGSVATLLSLLFVGFLILMFAWGIMNESSLPQPTPAPNYEFPMESSRT